MAEHAARKRSPVGPATRSLPEGPIPKHTQLREILLALADGEGAADAALPSERELMTRYRVSRATVRAAIGSLVSEGRLYRVHGKGTFVAAPRVESTLHLASFTQDMRRRGHAPATVVLDVRAERAPPQPRSGLQLAAEDTVWRVRRLRIADGIPMALELGWYPCSLVPGLDRRDLSASLYEMLAREYGLAIDSATQSVWSEVADVTNARLLGARSGAPLLVFRRVSAAGQQVVEYVTSWYRGDRYQVHMSLDRRSPVEPVRPSARRSSS